MLGSVLGSTLSAALARFTASETDVNEETIEELITEVCKSLVAADIQITLIAGLRTNLRKKCSNLGGDKRVSAPQLKRQIHQILFEELITIVAPQNAKKFTPCRGKSNVVMFVGLQGAGKTTTCTKFARYYAKRGWKVGLICADTYRAGAFDQLKQNAAKAKIPFYGSYTIIDPAEIAAQGVAKMKSDRLEIIIVDTSGRHKQEAALFEEMENINEAVKPDETIFVIDSHIGQACQMQAKAFKDAVDVASVIVTKLDGHAKGGGAISAVATIGCPISFIGTGEDFDDFEPFDPKGFISRILGLGDPERLMKTMEEFMPKEKRPEMIQRLTQGVFTYSDMKTQLRTMSGMGSMSSMLSMVPGMSQLANMLPQGQAGHDMNKSLMRFTYIIDSMTADERECRVELDEKRIVRLAYGSGSEIVDVHAMIQQHKMMSRMVGKLGKNIQQVTKKGGRLSQGMPGINGANVQEMMANLLGKK